MDPSTFKDYNNHGYDSRQYLEHYCSDKPDLTFKEDVLMFPIKNLTTTLKKGDIKGDLMIDLSTGSMVHYLLPACEFFKHILVLKVKDRCILELKRWLDTRTGAFNWGHAKKFHEDIAGSSDKLQNTEDILKLAVEHVVKCDLGKDDMTDPIVLPPADCIISAWLLDNVCENQDDYIRYLRKMSKMLKPGGHLILLGCLDISFYTVGKDTFRAFPYDEDFARKALGEVGFVIDDCKVRKRSAVSDLSDYKAVIFIIAHKEK